jgi:hypothetical protein
MLFVDPLVSAASSANLDATESSDNASSGNVSTGNASSGNPARFVAGQAEVLRTSRRKNNVDVERPATGLLVIAAEDYESIRQPVRDLAVRLGRLILGAALFVALVVSVLSIWLWSTLRRSHRRFALGGSSGAESISGTPA